MIGRPVAHTLAESLRFCFPFGGVPLASLAISQSGGPLIGVVRVGGAILLTWLTFQIGFALAGPSPGIPLMARRTRPGAKGEPHGMFGLLAVVGVIVLAAIAPTGHSTGHTVRVAVVQGGGPQGTHAIDVRYCTADGTPNDTGPLSGSDCVTRRQLTATNTIAASTDASKHVDIVVWPENVVDVASFEGSDDLVAIAAEAKRLDATFLVGVTEDAPGNHFANAQVVVNPDGTYTDRYDKVRRVPFGEYMPLRGLLQALGAPTNLVPRDAIAGHKPAYLTLNDGTRVAVAISWEIFFGGRARDGVSHGGQLLINPTNGSSYTWTVLQSQQVASSRLRAIETGRWVAQAAPTGFSAFVSPDGDVSQRTGISQQKVITRPLELRSGNTWYLSIGDKPWVALAVVILMLAVWRSGWKPALPTRRAAAAPTPDDDTAANGVQTDGAAGKR